MAGLATASEIDTLNDKSRGSSPASRIFDRTKSCPRSATSTLRSRDHIRDARLRCRKPVDRRRAVMLPSSSPRRWTPGRRYPNQRADRRRDKPRRGFFFAQAHHFDDLGVGLEHDAAALADAIDANAVLLGRRENRSHRAWSLYAWDLDAILGAVVEATGGGGQVVSVTGGEAERTRKFRVRVKGTVR